MGQAPLQEASKPFFSRRRESHPRPLPARGGDGRARRDQTGRHFPLSTLAKTGDDRNSLRREPVGPFSMTGLTKWTKRRPRGPTPSKYQQAHHGHGRAYPRHPSRGPRTHRSRRGGCRSRNSTCDVASTIRTVDVDGRDEPRDEPGHDVAGFCLAIHAFQTRAFGRPSVPQRQS